MHLGYIFVKEWKQVLLLSYGSNTLKIIALIFMLSRWIRMILILAENWLLITAILVYGIPQMVLQLNFAVICISRLVNCLRLKFIIRFIMSLLTILVLQVSLLWLNLRYRVLSLETPIIYTTHLIFPLRLIFYLVLTAVTHQWYKIRAILVDVRGTLICNKWQLLTLLRRCNAWLVVEAVTMSFVLKVKAVILLTI